MAKKILDGMLVGVGIVIVVGLAFAIAWAGDVFTIDKDGALKFAVSDAGKITVGATESYVNLVIQNNAGASTNKVDITADVLTVEGVRLEGLNVSADVTAAVGAGGRDTNFADAANTWYYVWVITNNDGTQKNGILTLAPVTPNPPTPPVLPVGFTKKRRVGAVRNNGSNNFLQFVQEGNKAVYNAGVEIGRILNSGQSATWAPVSAATLVPPTSRRATCFFETYVQHDTAGQAFRSDFRKAGTTTTSSVAAWTMVMVANIATDEEVVSDVDTDSTQNIEYKLSSVPSGGGGSYVNILGYYDRI